jgi:outer membrane protein
MKKTMKIPLMTLLLALMAWGSIEAQPMKLTVEETVRIALENNVDINTSRMDVRQAQAAVDEAFGYAYPTVDLSGQFYHFFEKPMMPFPDFNAMLNNSTYGVLFQEGLVEDDGTKMLPMGTSLQSFSLSNNYEAKIQATQILFSSAVFTGIGASERYLELAKESLRSQMAATVTDAKTAFYAVILTREMLDILKQSQNNAEENYQNVKAMFEAGLASEFDALQVEVRVENIKPQVVNLENKLKEVKDQLKLVLGLDQSVEIELAGNLDYKEFKLPDTDKITSQAMESSYDLNILKLKRTVDEAFVDLEEADYYPTIGAFGSYSRTGASDDFEFLNYNTGIVGINFSINLFRGGQTSNKVQQKKIEVLKTDGNIRLLEQYLRQQIKAQVLEVQRVQSQVEAQQRNVKLAERAYDIAKVRYDEGTGTQLEIKNADMELITARTQLYQSQFDYLKAIFMLNKLTGSVEEQLINEFIDKK